MISYSDGEVVLLDLKSNLNIGDRLQVIPLGRKTDNEYISQLAEIVDDEFLYIFIPLYKNNFVYFRNSEILRIIAPKKDAVYSFDAEILEKDYDKVPIIKLKRITNLVKIQRRGYYRLKITKLIKIRKCNMEDEENNSQHEGILVDISGGGALFFSKFQMEPKDIIEVDLNIDDKNSITLYGMIKRKHYDINKSFLYEYGIEFQSLKTSVRDILIRFIFDEQRKLLKRGLI